VSHPALGEPELAGTSLEHTPEGYPSATPIGETPDSPDFEKIGSRFQWPDQAWTLSAT